jgi:hypothetical protein
VKEALEVTLRVVSVLERLGAPYLVGGSIASSLHGFPRATQDVDVVADLRMEHVPAFMDALRHDFYVDETAVRDAVTRRASFNVIHLETMFKVDIFVAGDDVPTRHELARRQRYTLPLDPPREIVVASPEDIVIQKLYWFRLGDGVSERQWLDVKGVLKVRGGTLDRAYMRELAQRMGVLDLLDRVLEEAGLTN